MMNIIRAVLLLVVQTGVLASIPVDITNMLREISERHRRGKGGQLHESDGHIRHLPPDLGTGLEEGSKLQPAALPAAAQPDDQMRPIFGPTPASLAGVSSEDRDPNAIPKVMRGCIAFSDAQSTKVPQFRIFCDGMEITSDEHGFFAFPIMQGVEPLSKYRLIICNKLEHQFNNRNTLEALAVIPDKNYRCFKYVRDSNEESGWKEEEKDLKKKHLKVPPHSIVVLLSPKYFAGLSDWKGEVPDDTVKLPRIELTGDLPELSRAGVKSLLGDALDNRMFYEKVQTQSETSGEGKIKKSGFEVK